jgi:hypothetical protein
MNVIHAAVQGHTLYEEFTSNYELQYAAFRRLSIDQMLQKIAWL